MFGSSPDFLAGNESSGVNRISHPDWVKLSVELNCAPNQNTKFFSSLHFLQDRRFRVRMGEVFSEEKQQEMGVPQGSVLFVTLFNIKINNIVKNINSRTNRALYVDDFLICYRTRNMNHIERQLQICLDKHHRWTTENGLKFLKEKTKCIHFCNQRKLHLEILIVEHNKYLGIIFDRKPSIILHIKYLKTKCNKTIQILRTH